MNAKSVVVTIDHDAAGIMVRPMVRVSVDGIELDGVEAVDGKLLNGGRDELLVVTMNDGQEREFAPGTFEVRHFRSVAGVGLPRANTVEPHWLDVTSPGSEFEEQLDARAHPDSPMRMRHRRMRFTGDFEDAWIAGPAPREEAKHV